ncbi:MAG: DUF362 domain-containing protein, partial [Desulfobacterales bacterium]|nr:DUF362 domain-containing protein [Desulfobacterales bacterium]
MKHKVAIGAREDLKVVLDKIGGLERFVKSNDKVFIKPNLCAPKSYETGTTTDPYLIEEVIKLLSDISKNIKIGDGPIPAFQRLSPSSQPLIYKIAGKYGIEVLDLNYAADCFLKFNQNNEFYKYIDNNYIRFFQKPQNAVFASTKQMVRVVDTISDLLSKVVFNWTVVLIPFMLKSNRNRNKRRYLFMSFLAVFYFSFIINNPRIFVYCLFVI